MAENSTPLLSPNKVQFAPVKTRSIDCWNSTCLDQLDQLQDFRRSAGPFSCRCSRSTSRSLGMFEKGAPNSLIYDSGCRGLQSDRGFRGVFLGAQRCPYMFLSGSKPWNGRPRHRPSEPTHSFCMKLRWEGPHMKGGWWNEQMVFPYHLKPYERPYTSSRTSSEGIRLFGPSRHPPQSHLLRRYLEA